MTCVYTGAKVYMPDYSIAAPADLYEVGDVTIVKFHPSAFDGPFIDQPENTTHIIPCNPPAFVEIFKREGMIVLPTYAITQTEMARQ